MTTIGRLILAVSVATAVAGVTIPLAISKGIARSMAPNPRYDAEAAMRALYPHMTTTHTDHN